MVELILEALGEMEPKKVIKVMKYQRGVDLMYNDDTRALPLEHIKKILLGPTEVEVFV